MYANAKTEDVEASLVALGIVGSPLEAIMALVRLHARPELAQQLKLAFSPWHGRRGIGEAAAHLLATSLRRKELLGRAADDPSWNMLLAMVRDEERGANTSVTSACNASGAAPTTALRHVDTLTRAGLVKRSPDPRDLRKSFLTLAPSTTSRMAELIRSFCGAPPPRP